MTLVMSEDDTELVRKAAAELRERDRHSTAASMLEELVRQHGWPAEPSPSEPEYWPPAGGDLWRDEHGVRWLAQQDGSWLRWVLIPQHVTGMAFKHVAAEHEAAVTWFLRRRPRLLVPAVSRRM